jgi:hypothetical protein
MQGNDFNWYVSVVFCRCFGMQCSVDEQNRDQNIFITASNGKILAMQ